MSYVYRPPRHSAWWPPDPLPRYLMFRHSRLRSRPRATLPVLIATLATFGGRSLAGQPAPQSTLSVDERILGLSQIWQEVNRTFVFKGRLTYNVDSAYRQSLTRVIAAPDLYQYYRELQRFTAALHDGHSGVTFPSAMNNVRTYPWLQTRWIDGHLVIANSGKSLARTFPVGTEVLAIDGRPAREYMSAEVLPYISSSTEQWLWAWGSHEALYGRATDPVRVRFERPNGTVGDTVLARDRRSRDDAWALPTEKARFEFKWLADSIAYVALRTFTSDSIRAEFAAAVPAIRQSRGLIIDVRGNGGGNSGNGWNILARMVRDSLPLQVWRTRVHNAAYMSWGRPGYAQDSAFTPFESSGKYPPFPDPLLVPTVILQDNESFSAAEDFLVAANEIPRILTMGQPSGGSTGNPLNWQLPGGGFARIVAKHDRFPDGREFVGSGVQPRQVLPQITLKDFRVGRDPMLAAAMAVVRKQPSGKD